MRLCVWSLFDPPLRTLHRLSHLLLHPPDLLLHFPCGSVRREIPCALPRMRSLASWSTTLLSQVVSPNSSTTTTSQRPLTFSSKSPPATPGPRTCMTRRSVFSLPLFTQEREEPAGRRQAYHSLEESLLSSQSSPVGHVRKERPVNKFGSLSSNVRENPCRDSENEQIRILLERQKEQILADCRAEIQKHEFQADFGWRSIQKLNGLLSSLNEVRLFVLLKETNNFDEINNFFFMNTCWNKIENFVKLMWKVSMRWKNWSDFKGLHSIHFRRSRHCLWTHSQDSGTTEWSRLHEWFDRF